MTSEIRDATCTWCAYIRSFIEDAWMPEYEVTTDLITTHMKSCTPNGRNIFHLNITCNSPTGKWVGGSSLFLHAWTVVNDSASAYVTARPVRTNVDSGAARMQVVKWLEEFEGHDCCSASLRDSNLPTRVIEVSPPGRQHPRLLKSGNLRGIYATLSYCWGKECFLTFTRSNYSQLYLPLFVRRYQWLASLQSHTCGLTPFASSRILKKIRSERLQP